MSAIFTGETRESLEAESALWVVLRATAHSAAAAVLLLPLATTLGVISGALGAFLGCVISRRAARSSLRATTLVGFGAVLGAIGMLAGGLLVRSQALASALGPELAFGLSDSIRFLMGAAGLSFALRTLSLRRRVGVVLEGAVVALAFASYFAPHRDGAINRPFEIADPILVRGGDPTIAILLGGAVALAVIVLLFVRERRVGRTVLHLALLALLIAGVIVTTSMKGLPTPPPASDGLGLRNEQGQGGGRGGRGKNGEGESGGGQSGSKQRSMPIGIVLFHDDYSPPGGMYYFRQGAFSQFNGSRLVATTRDDIDRDLVPQFPTGTLLVRDPPFDSDFSESIETSVALLADHSQPFGLASPFEMRAAGNPNTSRFRRVYRVRSRALASDYGQLVGLQAGSSTWTPEIRTQYTTGPSDPRYAALATEILAEIPERLREDPILRTMAITDWLGLHGVYSLRSRRGDESDLSTEDFLFGERIGYCVHFSHAAVHLLRVAGLPARVATGYAVPEASRQGGSALLISDGDAHAWPEVYLDGVGWVVVDVAPHESLDPPPPPSDPDLQRLLGELARGDVPLPEDGEPPLPLDELARAALRALRTSALVLLSLALLLACLGKLWRRIAPNFMRDRARALALYIATLDVLSELGIRRMRGESRESFAARYSERIPSLARLTELHLAFTFGRGADVNGVLDAARATCREVKRGVPMWRRVLGMLEPISWMRTR